MHTSLLKIIPSFNDISVDVTAALINWQGFCELHELDAVDTLADVPEILYVPIEVMIMIIMTFPFARKYNIPP